MMIVKWLIQFGQTLPQILVLTHLDTVVSNKHSNFKISM